MNRSVSSPEDRSFFPPGKSSIIIAIRQAHTPEHWSQISGASCGGHRQSPINIVGSQAISDPNLHNFDFTNFTNQHALKTLVNNGHTVKCTVVDGQVEVSSGGLNGSYGVLQFHFHWGDTTLHPGSEHMLDGHRYPMEMHIVCMKKGLTISEALMDPEGIAVLGFFIQATEEGKQKPWQDLTSYLDNLNSSDSKVNISHSLSISDLLGDVDRTKFYRYKGSLTTPSCNEAVVWTVFQEPIQVHADLIKLFPTKTTLSNVYRPTQDLSGRHVYASPSTSSGQEHSWCYGDHCDFGPQNWHLLPETFCGGGQQSPVDIVHKDVVVDPMLNEFSFTNFDDKKAMDYLINTGHTVKCVLKEGVEVSGGGLDHIYSALQFHFHWGDDSDHPQGSEHMVDSVRYPMEMHIVNKRKDLSLAEAIMTQDGLAVLGFFIEVTQTSLHEDMSLDDLLGGVDRSMFYRYNGSLTTPTCNEAVVWTIFSQPIRMDKKLLDATWGQSRVLRSESNICPVILSCHIQSRSVVNTYKSRAHDVTSSEKSNLNVLNSVKKETGGDGKQIGTCARNLENPQESSTSLKEPQEASASPQEPPETSPPPQEPPTPPQEAPTSPQDPEAPPLLQETPEAPPPPQEPPESR
ncbi:Carbonic anhydrase 4 [Merluccius polli]|uniref:Carbonic anhydrase n=1 Tax=Merluccius polli TaxID=89951 RepID=A0AA47NA63_MERPO|nr:Carbonic anhydrase 4 [Merluccius polli]